VKTDEFSDILARLPAYRDRLKQIREVLLANLVMTAEIPAPTFGEADRTEFLCRRFSEEGLQNTSSDEKDNALGILPGSDDEQGKILVVAHMDTVFPESVNHTIAVRPDRMIGPAVGDNSLGVATIVSLPRILELLDLRLRSSLLLMGASRSLGRGNLEGLRFFLNHNTLDISAGVCVEGVPIGRLNIMSIGMLRGEITCQVPEEYDWTRFGASGAIVTVSEVVNRILGIPLPRAPRTTIVLGSLQGGKGFNAIAQNASLKFEVRSESSQIVDQVAHRIRDICAEVASSTAADVRLDVVARREPGGIPFGHPLARRARMVMHALDIPLRMGPSTSELATFIESRIPAITIGITTGESLSEDTESIALSPIFTGLAQLLGILLAIDGGYCHDGS